MSPRIPRFFSTFFSPKALRLISVSVEGKCVLVKAQALQRSAFCPKCHHRSRSLQSSYIRTIQDLPMMGLNVTVEIQTRRFRCRKSDCSQKIFSQPLDGIAKKYARTTERHDAALETLGRFLGGRPAARASIPLGIPTSRATALRRLRELPLEIPAISAFVGIDDFAFKKGHRYGTIVVDLPSHRVVDLLPDREQETVVEWLKSHPQVEVVSRDRSGAYAAAVNTAAPQVLQVADRFHLLKNITEGLQRVVESKHVVCRTVAQEVVDMIHADRQKETSSNTENAQEAMENDIPMVESMLTVAQQHATNRRERRFARYEEVIEFREQGHGLRKIAKITGLSRGTIRRWIRHNGFPELAPRARRRSIVDAWKNRIHEFYEQGMRKAAAIFKAIQKEGYRGSYTLIRDYYRQRWGDRQPDNDKLFIPRSWRSPRCITWSLLHEFDLVHEIDRKFIHALNARDEELRLAVKVAKDFASMVRTQGHALLAAWLTEAKTSLLASFAQTIERDVDCVSAAMREPWSQGCVEGNVNRLKVIKRQMYGKGKFDLLRRRVILKA
jgi:transposase